MADRQQKQGISWGVYINAGGEKQIIPCVNKQEAEALVAKHAHDVPLFGEPVIAKLIQRTKTITIEYSDWRLF